MDLIVIHGKYLNRSRFLTHGQLCTGLNKGFLRLNNSTIQLASQSSIDTLNSNITTINIEISSLKSSVSNGKSLIAAAVTDKGVLTAASDSFTTMSNNIRKIQTKEYSGPAPLSGTLAVGATIIFDSKSWIVMHNEGNIWYLGLATTDGSITFGQSDTYSGSNLFSKCKSWLSSNLSNNAQKYCIKVTVGDASCKVFPATSTQMTGGWQNTVSNNPYGRFVKSGNGGYYWLAGQYGYYANYILSTGNTGTLSVYESCGFRPFIAIQI